VEEPAVQDRLERALERFKLERVGHLESSFDATFGCLRPRHRDRRLSNVDAENRQSERGDEQSVFTASAACVEYVTGECAFGCKTYDRRLRLADIPRCRIVVVRRIPG
jgi:hypothetical protein